MLADLDLFLIAVFCAADDLLPERPSNTAGQERISDRKRAFDDAKWPI